MHGSKTVAVIGGGVAGLAAARALSARHLSVRVFEANGKIGGCCGATRMGGYTFNDGAVYLSLPRMLDHLFKRLGLERESLLPLRRIESLQSTQLPDGTVITIDAGPSIVIRGRDSNAASATRAELQAFLRRWDPLVRLFTEDVFLHRFSLPGFVSKGWRSLPMLRGSVAAQLTKDFSSDAVRAALSGALLFTGMAPEAMPALALVALAAMLRDGYFLPAGGMGSLTEVLGRTVQDAGGEIQLNSSVRCIVTRHGRVQGVETEEGGSFAADAVISTVSAMHTYGALLSDANAPRRCRRKARRAPLSRQGFVLQLGLKRKIAAQSFSMGTLPFFRDQGQVFHDCADEIRWPIYTVPTLVLPELAPPGGSIVEMYPTIRQDLAADDWSEELKARVAAQAIAALPGVHPADIEVSRILSPKEFSQVFHLHGGALYGLPPLASPATMFGHRSPVRGLFLAGQTTWPGFGVINAGLSGILAAERLLRTEIT